MNTKKEEMFCKGEINHFEIPSTSGAPTNMSRDEIMRHIYIYNKIRILNKYLVKNGEIQKDIFEKLTK